MVEVLCGISLCTSVTSVVKGLKHHIATISTADFPDAMEIFSYLHLSWRWAYLAVMLLLFTLEYRQLRGRTEWWFDGDRTHKSRSNLWWPPRLSNILILYSLIFLVYDWIQHPPAGSRLGLRICWWSMLLGFICRQYERGAE
jgi:hypothetical protein